MSALPKLPVTLNYRIPIKLFTISSISGKTNGILLRQGGSGTPQYIIDVKTTEYNQCHTKRRLGCASANQAFFCMTTTKFLIPVSAWSAAHMVWLPRGLFCHKLMSVLSVIVWQFETLCCAKQKGSPHGNYKQVSCWCDMTVTDWAVRLLHH